MPNYHTRSLKEANELNQVVTKLNKAQLKFQKEGFITPDQENWIDLKGYQNNFGKSIVGLLSEIQVQHEWLTENVSSLVQENKRIEEESLEEVAYQNQKLVTLEKQLQFEKQKNEKYQEQMATMNQDFEKLMQEETAKLLEEIDIQKRMFENEKFQMQKTISNL